MVFDQSTILRFVIKKLNFNEFPSFLIEVDQEELLVKLKASVADEQLVVVTHDVLLGLMNVHRLQTHIWRIFSTTRARRPIVVLIFLLIRAVELPIQPIFESIAQRHLLKFLNLIMQIRECMVLESKPAMENSLEHIHFEDCAISGDVLVQIMIVLVCLIF